MENKQFVLDAFHEELADTLWLKEKDSTYAEQYKELFMHIQQEPIDSENTLWRFIDQIDALKKFYFERAKNPSAWVTPKKRAANELIHDESGKLTQESIDLLQFAISDKAGEKTLISDTGKTISFSENWHTMLQDSGFKAIAVERLTDFISKFIEPNGWAKYFVGNIGKNDKRLIQEYHVMDKYNLKHGTSYAAMHLGNTTRCVLVEVETSTADGRGEPSSMTFLEVGAHTIIDRFIVGSFNKKSITEAGPDDLAELFEVN